MTKDDELAALKARVAELERANKPMSAEASERETALWRDQMHQAREARANSFRFSPAVQREMDAACDHATAHDLASHGTVQGPSGAGTSGQVVEVRVGGGSNVPGGGTGWRHQRPSAHHPASLNWIVSRRSLLDAIRPNSRNN